MPVDELTLFTLPDSSLLHTRECPHLVAARLEQLVPATATYLEMLTTCASCRGLLDGGRRRTYATLDAAMEAYKAPLENRARLREIAAGLTYSRVWIPASGSSGPSP